VEKEGEDGEHEVLPSFAEAIMKVNRFSTRTARVKINMMVL
jgi:hypothetical protein